MSIILAYCDKHIGDNISYVADTLGSDHYGDIVDAVYGTGSKLELGTLKYTDNIISSVNGGSLLNGRQFEHILNNYTIYNIVITADELMDSTKLGFIKSFWKSNNKYLVVSSKYIFVVSGGGELPKEFIEENKYLPEVTLKLTGGLSE